MRTMHEITEQNIVNSYYHQEPSVLEKLLHRLGITRAVSAELAMATSCTVHGHLVIVQVDREYYNNNVSKAGDFLGAIYQQAKKQDLQAWFYKDDSGQSYLQISK